MATCTTDLESCKQSVGEDLLECRTDLESCGKDCSDAAKFAWMEGCVVCGGTYNEYCDICNRSNKSLSQEQIVNTLYEIGRKMAINDMNYGLIDAGIKTLLTGPDDSYAENYNIGYNIGSSEFKSDEKRQQLDCMNVGYDVGYDALYLIFDYGLINTVTMSLSGANPTCSNAFDEGIEDASYQINEECSYCQGDEGCNLCDGNKLTTEEQISKACELAGQNNANLVAKHGIKNAYIEINFPNLSFINSVQNKNYQDNYKNGYAGTLTTTKMTNTAVTPNYYDVGKVSAEKAFELGLIQKGIRFQLEVENKNSVNDFNQGFNNAINVLQNECERFCWTKDEDFCACHQDIGPVETKKSVKDFGEQQMKIFGAKQMKIFGGKIAQNDLEFGLADANVKTTIVNGTKDDLLHFETGYNNALDFQIKQKKKKSSMQKQNSFFQPKLDYAFAGRMATYISAEQGFLKLTPIGKAEQQQDFMEHVIDLKLTPIGGTKIKKSDVIAFENGVKVAIDKGCKVIVIKSVECSGSSDYQKSYTATSEFITSICSACKL